MNSADFIKTLNKANGYITLGMYEEAESVLESLPSEQKISVEVLTVRLSILAKTEDWIKSAYLAESLTAIQPSISTWALSTACYLDKAGNFIAALEWLSKIEGLWSGEPLFHYFKAQAECGEGDLQSAKDSLKIAFAMDPNLRLEALKDPLLMAVW